MNEGLVVLDSHENVVLFNRAAGNLLDLSYMDYVGTKVELLEKALAEKVENFLQFHSQWRDALSRLGKARELDFEFRSTPLTRNIRATLFPVGDETGRIGTGVLLRDVTHEREVNRIKTDFISMASHELRTPLTAVLGFAELLLSRASGLSEEQRKWLDTICKESKRLSDIVEDLLNVSHIEAGRLSLNAEPVTVALLAETIMDQLRPGNPAHTLTVDIPQGIPDILADKAKLHQVMFNLLENAVKYSPNGGPIIVRATKSPHDNGVMVAVSDRGIGIQETDVPKLFTRFFRGNSPVVRKVRGTGLGLFIAKSLVELMGGRIWAESKVNEGSTFSFSLPAVTD